MPAYKIKHTTRYSYSNPVLDCINQIMLYPIQDHRQNVISHEITISHHPSVELFVDYFGNKLGVFSIVAPHDTLLITSVAEVITAEAAFPEDRLAPAEQRQLLLQAGEQFPFFDFLQAEPFEKSAEADQLIQTIHDDNKTPFENARRFSEFIYKNFEYRQGITGVETGVNEIWNLKAGVCQDFAHMLLLLLRKIHIPSRYVSGYICPKNNELRGEGATHAWIEVYIPDYGWIGLDPTNNCIASDRHIRLAVGRNFSDCTPVKGTFRGLADHELEVSVVIKNGVQNDFRGEEPAVAPFVYQSKSPAPVSANSYQKYVEQMQMQQQQ